MSKQRIAVLRGGPSPEYEVSMETGRSVLEALKESSRYEPIDINVTRKGEWLREGIVKQPYQFLDSVDGVFNAMHGAYGEDGVVQRILEQQNIPFNGSRSFASALAMNKILTKEHLYEQEDMHFAPHMRVASDKSTDINRIAVRLEELLGNQCVIKPVHGGSSLGTHISNDSQSLSKLLNEALKESADVIVEKRIKGVEATCAVVENFRGHSHYTLPVIEIAVSGKDSFFDHEAKYSGKTKEICPGRFSNQEKELMARIAVAVHKTLGIKQY